jgi:hypoxanthine-DNA glycosylase
MHVTNPFRVFCPPGARYLILGSFAAKDGKKGVKYGWYYSNGRNQFWPILERIYKTELKTRRVQQELFRKLSIAIADIIYQCTRTKNSSLDVHLTDFVYNFSPIKKVLQTNHIKKIFFTSRFVEQQYRRRFKSLIVQFPNIKLITLPSPSPRYAVMNIAQKTEKYRQTLPKGKL